MIYPKIGIRPTIDGRWGGIREGLEEQTMGLANAAKELMKQLGDQYSDYEHYPSLKKYFTNTLAFFDFCCNPEGSFEQIVSTFNNYRNNAREYFFDLNYVFGDSIGGMDDYLEADEAESEHSEDAQDSEMAPTAAPAPEATAPTEGY